MSFTFQLLKYALVGVANTLMHWLMFLACLAWLDTTQSRANLAGFLAAATFSFYANARFTFSKRPTGLRYCAFMVFMGALSYGTGWVADTLAWPPLLTLVLFSLVSLGVGFLYSRYVVFADFDGARPGRK